MNKFFHTVASFLMLVTLCGCGHRDDPVVVPDDETDPDPVTQVTFARGADISWVSEMEYDGITFKYNDSKGATDIFGVLKDLGMNSVRLRVWVNPYDENGWSGQDDVVKMAKRALKAGLAIMIDFHYSDFFADPGYQSIPLNWSKHSKDVTWVSESLAAHTTAVLLALKSEGVVPAWVQVGNETNNGMAWDTGKIDWDKTGSARYSDYVILSNAGYDAVKEVFPSTPVIVHIANAYNAGDYDGWFFREFKEAGGKFDMIGLSHYPMSEKGKSWTEMNSSAVSSIKTLSAKFSCKVIVCEVGVKPSSSEAASCMSSFMSSVKALGSGVCAGVFYWEPEADGKWKPAIYSKYGLVCNGWSAYDGGAFTSSGTVFTPISSILAPFFN